MLLFCRDLEREICLTESNKDGYCYTAFSNIFDIFENLKKDLEKELKIFLHF